MDAKRLFWQLDADSVYRVGNDTLNDFYKQMKDEITAQVVYAENRLKDLIISMKSQDHDSYI